MRKICSECHGCSLDERIPCSPDCNNLIGNMINIQGCLSAKCEEIFYIYDIKNLSIEISSERNNKFEEMMILRYGNIAKYPIE